MTFRVRSPPDYDLTASVHAWIYSDIHPVPELTREGLLARRIPVAGEDVAVAIRQTGQGGDITVEHTPTRQSTKEMTKAIVRILGLSEDFSCAVKSIKRDPRIRGVASGVNRILPYQSPTVFEALIKTVIQQQVSYRAANVLTQRLVTHLEEPVHLSGLQVYGFPPAEKIAALGLDQLRFLGLGFKAEYVHSISTMVSEGNLDTEALRSMEFGEVEGTLRPIRGIGDWTIETLCIAGLSNFDVFPHGDLGIQNLLGRLYNKGLRMTAREVESLARKWDDGSRVLYLLMCADVLGLFPAEGRLKTIKRPLRK